MHDISKISLEFTSSVEDIRQILLLQSQNLRSTISEEESISDGFLFVKHDPATLLKMCEAEPAVVARYQGKIIAYALCMTRKFGSEVPELIDFFNHVHSLSYKKKLLESSAFVACGQVCVHKEFRSNHLMADLYSKMRSLNSKYEFCITDISSSNTRSLHAHHKVGFTTIDKNINKYNEEWQIVLWEWRY